MYGGVNVELGGLDLDDIRNRKPRRVYLAIPVRLYKYYEGQGGAKKYKMQIWWPCMQLNKANRENYLNIPAILCPK